MQLYLLLRNNQQSGPYSLEELLQLNLKPFDLVWVEGRSAAWQYPEEIAALHPYVPSTPRPEPFAPIATAAMENDPSGQIVNHLKDQPLPPAKSVFVSMPRKQPGYMQPSAEPDPIPVFQPQKTERFSEPEKTYEERTTSPVTDDRYENYSGPGYTFSNPSRKKTSLSGKDMVIAALIVAVIATGYYLISKPSVITKRAVPEVAKELPSESTQPIKTEPRENNTPVVTTNEKPIVTPGVKQTALKNDYSMARKEKARAPSTEYVVTVPSHKDEVLKEEPRTIGEVKNQGSSASGEKGTQKKKKLGDVIKNIFTKKKKEPEVKADPAIVEEPHPATNRQSTKRSEDETVNKKPEATPPPVTNPETNKEESPAPNLADLVDLSSNAPSSWMMGVTGLKITLKNRSNSTIQTAAVNVFYYDDNNRLLDKKMIYFSNVPPRGKLTLPAPDHKFADHVEFRLGAVSAKDDRYAKG
jgi:hypothetical protein